jgi:gamma-glutamyltranspeptidase/glutathione hydrolase
LPQSPHQEGLVEIIHRAEEHVLQRKPAILIFAALSLASGSLPAVQTQKPPLHATHWIAITGKPLGATAGAMIFRRGGNAVDAAAAMIAATATMWDTLGWGGETQALIYNPHIGKVVGIDALGVAPTGATPRFFKQKGMQYPPEYGPLAAVTPGTPGGIMVMVAEYGRLSLKDVLEPAIEMADGYAIERQAADTIERHKKLIKRWPYSRAVFLPHVAEERHGRPGNTSAASAREAPEPGEIFRQPDLAATLRKLVEAEQEALEKRKSRREAIYAAYDRFYRGDIAQEIVRGVREQDGLFTMQDLANWKVRIEEPVTTNYKGIDVYKLTVWTQGPVLLQMLNMLEPMDLRAMGYNSARYIHTIYQAMNLAYADRDFYYGDPYFPPEEPVKGLLSKAYARERAKRIDPDHNAPDAGPGDPYPFQGGKNPYLDLLAKWPPKPSAALRNGDGTMTADAWSKHREAFYAGTTSVEAADSEGWVVSVTPSGGWIPAVIAGHTGIGLSQRMQSFVLERAENPYNVVEPGKRPRVTLTPSLALRDGKPFLSFAVQGGDSQDQNLLQFFLDVVEFGMSPQQAAEAANFNSYQMRSSFGDHEAVAGKILLNDQLPSWVRDDLRKKGYRFVFDDRTSGPINAILLDRKHGTLWGASSNHGEDYGIAW